MKKKRTRMKLQEINKIYKPSQKKKKNQKNGDYIWEIRNWRRIKLEFVFQFEVIFSNKTIAIQRI